MGKVRCGYCGMIATALLLSLSPVGYASNLGRQCASQIKHIEEQIAALKGQTEVKAVVGDIAVAQRWIAEGKMLLKEGRVRQATVLAERLVFQLRLIRLLMATQRIWDQAERIGQQRDKVRQDLEVLKSQYDALVLQRHGAALTGADEPQKDEQP